jgi:excisionase family DNA binding protein
MNPSNLLVWTELSDPSRKYLEIATMPALSQSTVSKSASVERATYTLAEFAALLGVSYTQAHERAQSGTLPVTPVRFGRKYLFPRRTVDELLGLTPDASEASNAA